MSAQKGASVSHTTKASSTKRRKDLTTFEVDKTNRSVVMTSFFDATPQRVFDAWTKPEQIARWWGGAEGSQLVVCKVDLRPGGAWRFVECSSDGHEYPFKGIYREIDPPSRLVSTFAFDVEPFAKRAAEVATLFSKWKGGTKLVNTTVFRSVKDLEAFVQSGMESGGRQSNDRLVRFLRLSEPASS
ncbi:MAG: SRPBCC domain-containing protein [Thermoplasmata archaeon]